MKLSINFYIKEIKTLIKFYFLNKILLEKNEIT